MADDVHEMLDDSMLIGSGFAEGECDILFSLLPASHCLSSSIEPKLVLRTLLLWHHVEVCDREVRYKINSL